MNNSVQTERGEELFLNMDVFLYSRTKYKEESGTDMLLRLTVVSVVVGMVHKPWFSSIS